MVPEEEVAISVNVPGPVLAKDEAIVILGMIFTVAKTAVLLADVQPLLEVSA